MSFWKRLFGVGGPRVSFAKLDWLEIEGKIRELEILLKSSNQAEKKQVIIQADMLIDKMFKHANVPGNTFGERLKSLRDKMPRPVYSNLWAAHIKRNELVHESGSYIVDWELEKHFRSFKDSISALRGIR